MLEGHIQIGQYAPLGHERNDLIDARVGVDIVQPHPGPEFAQRSGQLEHPGTQRTPAPESGSVTDVNPVSTRILRDHQQLTHARAHQILGLGHHIANRAADQITAHLRDDAKGTAMVAAFRNLEIGVVPWRESYALWRHQALERIVPWWQVLMNRIEHFIGGMRPGHRQYPRKATRYHVAARAETTRHDDLAVFLQRLANGLERLGHGIIDEATGVDHHQIGAGVVRGNDITLCTQTGEDALGIDQCLRTTERYETDLGYLLLASCHQCCRQCA